MPITYRIDARRSLVVTTITGHIRKAELRAHATAAAADPNVQAWLGLPLQSGQTPDPHRTDTDCIAPATSAK